MLVKVWRVARAAEAAGSTAAAWAVAAAEETAAAPATAAAGATRATVWDNGAAGSIGINEWDDQLGVEQLGLLEQLEYME